AEAENHAAASVESSARHGRGRDSGGAGDPGFDAVASPREAEKRRPGYGASGTAVSVVRSERRRAARAPRLSLRAVLLAQQADSAGGDNSASALEQRSNLQGDECGEYQGDSERKVWTGGA